jgi:Domain of unknown function (DUF305)
VSLVGDGLVEGSPRNTGNFSRRSPIASTPWKRRRSVRITTSSRRRRFFAAAFAVSSKGQNSLADYVSAVCSQRFQSASATEATYLAENVSAMTKMMLDMGIRPSGDIDSDFVAMMTPHHQGAIEMAQAELRYGRNERLKRMAQEIIVTQLDEIAAMRLAVGLSLSVPALCGLAAGIATR